MKLKDSGKRSKFKTGAVRDAAAGKGRFDLLPFEALWEIAKVYEAGAAKYEARNWEKGIPLHRFVDSAMRHLTKWQRGDRDEPHLAMAAWNLVSLLQTVLWIEHGELPAELCDLPRAAVSLPRAELTSSVTTRQSRLRNKPGKRPSRAAHVA